MEITEFETLDPDRVDGVGSPANGVGFLMLKSIEENTPDEVALHKELDTEIGECRDEHVTKFVSAAQRRKDAEAGVAMPNGDFPIPDEGHLRSAVGHLGGYTGDKAAAKRHIIKRARALHLTHLLPEDWNVSKDATKQTAPDKSVPESEALAQTRQDDDAEPAGPPPDNEDHGEPRHVPFPHGSTSDGQGDTAPDKDLREDEALAQTRSDPATKAEGDGTGDTAPDKDLHEDEAESQTRDNEEGNAEKADPSDPGSPAWEHTDVALGEKAEQLAAQLTEVIRTFTEREKAEGGASKSQWRVIRRIRSLLENPESLRKVAETMSDTTELIKALGELDDARRAAKQARKEKEAKKAAKAEAAKAADEAAEAAGADEAAKATDDQIAALQKQIDELSAKRPFVNEVGVSTVLRGPGAVNALKAFDDRVSEAEARLEKAHNEFERQRAQSELETAMKARFRAKMVAADNARDRGILPRGRFGPNSADLFGGTSLTLPDEVGKGSTKYLGA